MPPGAAAAGLAAAYDASAGAWADGPERLYGTLAEALLDRSPRPLAGRRIVDVGTGTGVAARALSARGAVPLGVDVSLAMLRHGAGRAPGAVADATALPFGTASAGGAVYAFSLNHLTDPVAALAEARRVVAPGGVILGAVFAAGNDHPAKDVVDAALAGYGWRRPDWYADLKDVTEPLLATPSRFAAAAVEAGLGVVEVVETAVDSGLDTARDLVAWRLGMAHVAPYVATLSPGERAALAAAAESALGPAPEPFRPRVVLLAATGNP